MNRVPVASSNLAEIGYSAETHTLEILFHSGHIYQYSGVTESEFAALMNSASKGRYFDQFIRYSHGTIQLR